MNADSLAFFEAVRLHDSEKVAAAIAAGIDVNMFGEGEMYGDVTPLIVASFQGDVPIVKILLDAGANPTLAHDERLPPIFFATRRYSPEVITLLVKAGANINQKTADGNTPLHYFCQNFPDYWTFSANPTIQEKREVFTRMLETFAKLGADFNAVRDGGKTPYDDLAWRVENSRYVGFGLIHFLGEGAAQDYQERVDFGNYQLQLYRELQEKPNRAARKIQNFLKRKTAKRQMFERSARPPGTLGPNNTGGEVYKLWEQKFYEKHPYVSRPNGSASRKSRRHRRR